ncbi:MAG: glycosyl hydrolase family 28-related protein [Blastocatellia bacterium]
MISSYSRASLAIIFLLSVALSVESTQDVEHRGGRKPSGHSVGGGDLRLGVYQNIVAFGALGDGRTDNSEALQQAINAGHAIIIPEGVFNFSKTLRLRKDSLITGVGKKSTLRYTGAGVALSEPEGSYVNGHDNLKLMNFTLTTGSASQVGIELINNYQVTLSGLYIDGARQGFKTAGVHIIGSRPDQNSAIIRIIDGEIWFCLGDGVKISGQGGSAGLWIERNHISGNAYGVNQTLPSGRYPAVNIQIKNNVIEGNTRGAINAEALHASAITGNYFENSDGSDVTLARIGNGGYAQGLNISENNFGGKKAAYNIDMNGPADVTGLIANNMFAGAAVAAIRIRTARGLIIENNTLEPGTAPQVVELGAPSRSVWIKDLNRAAYISGAAEAQPDLSVGGRLILGGAASLRGVGGSAGELVETRTADGSRLAPHAAQYFKQASGPTWMSGPGAPTGACVTGSLYTRTDGRAGSTLYVCEQSTWVAK